VIVRGLNFGDSPRLKIGGQELVVDRLEAAGTIDEYDRIYAKTIPNYAGPAAVTVINEAGLQDTVLGGFTYVDLLQISFVNPAVVKSDQNHNEFVDIVGYGFHSDVSLKVYKSGQPGTAENFTVDNRNLTVYSAERMKLLVPDFDGAGSQSYRGFVDFELTDKLGRRYVLHNALFYGRLSVNRALETED